MNSWKSVLKWTLSVIVFLILACCGILLEKPQGSIAGTVSFTGGSESPRVIAYGPVVRASYADALGRYKIDGLPVGKYNLKVKARSFYTESLWDVEVKEAQITTVNPVKLTYVTPNLSLSSNFSAFMPGESPYFWFTASGIDDNVKLKLYKFDPKKLITGRDDYTEFLINERYYGTDNYIYDIINGAQSINEWDRKISYEAEDNETVPFRINDNLAEGAYILLVEGKSSIDGKKYHDPYWFTVTKYGLITKQDPTKVLVRAVDLETLQPVEGFVADIYDKSRRNKLIGSAKTNKDGLTAVQYSKDRTSSDTSLIIFGQKGTSTAFNGSSTWYYAGQDYKVFSYTDRPVYRPGQTVYFRGIARKIDGNGLKTLSHKSLVVKVYDQDNELVRELWFTTGDFGTYSGLIELPDSAKLGNYTIEATIDQNKFSSYFEIAEYRKPEYKVEVIPGSEIVQGGNTATATVKATYFFGYPVKDANVKFTVYASPDWEMRWKLLPRPDYYAFFDDWGDNYYDYGYSSGDIIAEGEARTDENGEAKVTFSTKKVRVSNDEFYSYSESLPQDYKVEADVTDISRQTSTGSGHFNVTPGDFAIFIEPEYYVYTPDQDIKVKVSTVNYDKQFIPEKVTLQLQKWTWDEDNYRYTKPQIVQEKSITTGSTGNDYALLHIPNDLQTQDYRIVTIARDAKGNEITTTEYIWISNSTSSSDKNARFKPDIKLNFDKKVYKPGEVAKMVIISPVKEVKALVTIEGSSLYKYQTVDIPSNSKMISIPVTREYMPNAYVSVSLVGPQKQFYEIQKRLLVSPEDRFLKVEVKANKKKYQPGEPVEYTIKAVDSAGKPVKAELSIGVVDESIYSIREDWTEDIRKFFYSQRANLVNTVYSFVQSNSAGGDKIEPKLRKDFKETAFWDSTVKTDENGIAKVKFFLPDNLTTWRTTVRAVTPDTKVAAVTDKILVTKDIIIRAALPRFYTVGDRAILATVVHNYTDKIQKIKLRISFPQKMTFNGPDKLKEKWIEIPPQEQVKTDWKLKINEAGSAVIRAYALSPLIEGDAVEQEINILPYGVPISRFASGNLSDDSTQLALTEKLPREITPGSLTWKLRLSPTNLSMLIASLNYLVTYPYGCTEQTMSSFMPAVVIDYLTKGYAVEVNKKTKDKLPSVVSQGLNRLYMFQHYDGSWGWWENDKADPYLTSYVLHGLTYPKLAGIKVKEDVTKKGITWLEGHLKTNEAQKLSMSGTDTRNHANLDSKESVSDFCYESYVLALYGKTSPVLGKLYENRSNIDNLGLAYLALTYSELKSKDKAIECARLLPANGSQKPESSSFDADFYNENEVNAVILRALIKTGADQTRINSLAQKLINSRQGGHWNNTKTTANVILALADYAIYSSEKITPDCDAVIKANDKEVATIHFDKTNMYKPEKVIEIPKDLLKRKNNITITKKGSGRLYYNSELSYYELYEPEKTIPAVENDGIKITKTFYRMKPETDVDGNIIYKEYRLIGPAKVGEILLVDLNVFTPKNKEYVLITDPKASGMEVVSKWGSDYGWDYWWTHEENRDEYMAFFITRLVKGDNNFRYLVRTELPGNYLINPTTVEGMYSSQQSASSTSSRITVNE